jgi:uncharacterized protein (TIGR03086 family)
VDLDRLTLDLLERSLGQTGDVVGQLRLDQASLPTPCTAFDMRALVNHTVYDLRAFNTQLSGGERESADRDLIGQHWSAAYRAAADGLMATWRRRGVEGTLNLQIGQFPVRWAVGQHLADVAVHGWDIARAADQTVDFDTEVGEAALDWARENLKPQFRGQAFGAEVPVDPDAPLYDRLAAFFGRDPNWK